MINGIPIAIRAILGPNLSYGEKEPWKSEGPEQSSEKLKIPDCSGYNLQKTKKTSPHCIILSYKYKILIHETTDSGWKTLKHIVDLLVAIFVYFPGSGLKKS